MPSSFKPLITAISTAVLLCQTASPTAYAKSSLASSAATGAIVGQVTGAGSPMLAYITVYSSRNTSSYVTSASTDAATGQYTITGLSSGNYYLEFSTPPTSNFVGEAYDNKSEIAQATAVVVGDGVTATANADLAIGAIVSGTVTRDEGGANWSLMRVEFYTSTAQSAPLKRLLVPDSASGHFRAGGFAPGVYYVYFNTFHEGDVLSEWYDNAGTRAQATPVTLTVGTTTTIQAGLARGATLVGQLTDATDGSPIGGNVTVYANRNGNYVTGAGTLDGQNRYTVTGLAAGAYFIGVQPNAAFNHRTEYYLDQSTLDSATPLTVSINTTYTVNFQLERAARITGRVTMLGSGAPISDVSVSASRIGEGPSEYRSATTDASGYYTINQLSGGGYSIFFDSDDNFLPEYHGDTSLYPGSLVTVAAQSVAGGIDAQLAIGGRILGRVTAADTSNPLSPVYIELEKYNDGNYNSVGGSSPGTDANGLYTVTQLASGRYRLKFRAGNGNATAYLSEFYNNAQVESLATDITVTQGSDVTGIDGALERGGQISGTVRAEGSGDRLPNINVEVYRDGTYIARVRTDNFGDYLTEGLAPGNYTVYFEPQRFQPEADLYAPEWFDGSNKAGAALVNVIAAQTTANINASLVAGAILEGRVRYKPGTWVYVRIYDATTNDMLRQEFFSEADGSIDFSLRGFAAGPYKLGYYGGAVDSLARGTTDYIERYFDGKTTLASATVITVSASQTITGLNHVLANNSENAGRVSLPIVLR